MDLYLIGSLLLALGITVFVVSRIAEMLHAKKPGIERILLASLVGSIAAFATLVAFGALVKNVDPITLIFISVLSMLIVSSFAFKAINEMSWGAAITTNIANVALILLTTTAAVVLNGESIDNTIKSAQNIFNTNTEIVENIASGNNNVVTNVEDENSQNVVNEGETTMAAITDEEEAIDDNLDPTFNEIDLLPAGAVKEIKAKEKFVYKAPKYRVISLSSARSAVGKNIRIKNTSGRSIIGALKNISANNLIVERRINGGLATIPISMAKIEKLEVYR